jgi:ADP-ribosylglycohydrolase
MFLTAAQLDRARGVLLATAAGDALGAGYEFGPPLADGTPVVMSGGGSLGWEPGEWTDDTSMAIAIAEVAARGGDLRAASAQDAIVARWATWAKTAPDVGNQTRLVLGAVADQSVADQSVAGQSVEGQIVAGQSSVPVSAEFVPDPFSAGAAGAEGATGTTRTAEGVVNSVASSAGAAATALKVSGNLHMRTGHTAGNGSLMRTAPVALAYLRDGREDALTDAATQLSAVTHFDPEAGEACVLWCHIIRHAVLTGELEPGAGLRYLRNGSRRVWAQRLDEASRSRPADFTHNGWVVEALQGAWSAITTAPATGEPAGHLRVALEAAVRGGRDADTVAAIAGGVLGAVHGASAVPAQWREILHGWPGLNAEDLATMAERIVTSQG